jgi:hypothetical protein
VDVVDEDIHEAQQVLGVLPIEVVNG